MEVQATISRTDLTKFAEIRRNYFVIVLWVLSLYFCGIWLEKLVCIFVIFGRINIFSIFRLELKCHSRFSNVLYFSEDEIISSVVISSSGLRMPFKTPPVAIKRILWTCLVISCNQAPLSPSKAKSDGFTLYLSVSQIALSSCLRPFRLKWLLRLSRSPMASSQLSRLLPTFRPNHLVLYN